MQTIDMHSHMFNYRYIPVEGILRQHKVPRPLAKAISIFIEGFTHESVALEEHDEILKARHSTVLKHISEATSDEVFLEPQVCRALDCFSPKEVRSLRLGSKVQKQFNFSRFKRIGRYGIRGLKNITKRIAYILKKAIFDKAMKLIQGGKQLLKWLFLMKKKESKLYRTARRTYPKVGLIVHHMMDMENYYNDTPRYRYSQQITKMRMLAEHARGRLVGFVAYDPLRENYQEIITSAINGGFCGVKFYPPNGYRAIGNTGTLGRKVDEHNRWLFRFCVDNDVPIFTHCTKEGFEAKRTPNLNQDVRHSGLNSNPDYWEEALSEPGLSDLRLCLGHGGGGNGWFAGHDPRGQSRFRNSYAWKVAKLCTNPRFPNVYCGMGYLDEILGKADERNLRRRLEELLTATPDLAEKIVYGTDWHMIYKEVGHARYLDAFDKMFSESDVLRPYKKRFLAENAASYLNISGFLQRSAAALTAREKAHLRRFVV